MFIYINFSFDFLGLDKVYSWNYFANVLGRFLSLLKHTSSVLYQIIRYSAVTSCFISDKALLLEFQTVQMNSKKWTEEVARKYSSTCTVYENWDFIGIVDPIRFNFVNQCLINYNENLVINLLHTCMYSSLYLCITVSRS